MRFYLLSIFVGAMLCASQGACELDPAFECTAWCLGDAETGVTATIHAEDLGAAVMACQTWLTCNAGPNDQTRCLCTEVR